LTEHSEQEELEALDARVREVQQRLTAERPELDVGGWKRAVIEQLLFELDVHGVYPFIAKASAVAPKDHGLSRRQVVQALGVFPIDGGTEELASFLLAILDGEQSVIDAGVEVFQLGRLPDEVYRGPFQFSAKS
jgi:hypothetical protein